MDEGKLDIDRRGLLQAAVAGSVVAMMEGRVMASEAKGKVTGKGIGDFDFLTGEWTIKNKRLKDGTKDQWDEFDGASTVYSVLGGMASIEELRARGKYLGMGVRVWRPEEKMWADHWTGYYNGVVNVPQMGQFIDGEGIFISKETVDCVDWQYRGVWDRITPHSCCWHQSASSDGGKSWEWNWYMDWTRVA